MMGKEIYLTAITKMKSINNQKVILVEDFKMWFPTSSEVDEICDTCDVELRKERYIKWVESLLPAQQEKLDEEINAAIAEDISIEPFARSWITDAENHLIELHEWWAAHQEMSSDFYIYDDSYHGTMLDNSVIRASYDDGIILRTIQNEN